MATVSSKNFDWFPERRTFIAEMSELPEHFRFEQVYPDACDAGFHMLSHRTGQEIVFVMSATDMSGEDIAGWRFVPTRESLRRVPSAAGVSVLIIND